VRTIFLTIFGLALSVSAAAPRITRNSPTAVMPGASIDVTFSGENLEPVTNLWSSFSCDYSKVKSSASEAVFRITVRSNILPQLALVRLASTNALSNLQLLLVDDLPSIPKRDARKASPQSISAGVAVDGATEEMQIDYFTFKAKKNEELSFDLFARRIGSTLDPIVRLLDSKGREHIYSLKTSEPNGDGRFRFKAPESGNYTIELRDVSYHGGPNYFYRLRFGHFPLLTASFPAVIEESKQSKLKLIGPFGELTPRTSPSHHPARSFPGSAGVSPADGALIRFLPLAAKSRDNSGSGFTSALVADLPQISEAEPNDKTNRATPINIPAGLNGQFNQPGDLDYYQFEVEKGDRLLFIGQTRSLGSPCDLSLRLFDTNGAQIAESSNTTASEGALTNTFDKAGTYRLLVEELTGAAAPDFLYHVDVKRQPAGFGLFVDTDKAERTTNGFSLQVSCARDRYDGPIKLTVFEKDSCALDNATIAAKKTNTTLRIKLPETMTAAEFAVVRMFGEAVIRDQPFTAPVSTLPALRKSFPMLLYPPVQFNGLIWIGPK
jgi:hypothetical protein